MINYAAGLLFILIALKFDMRIIMNSTPTFTLPTSMTEHYSQSLAKTGTHIGM